MANLPRFLEELQHSKRESPIYSVSAPGRLSILGEHIDYSGYGVFAFAIEQNINVICSVNNMNVFRFRNVDSIFANHDVPVTGVEIDPTNLHWTDYILCGIRGIFDESKKHGDYGDVVPPGSDFLVSGDIPRSAGLSSSSALVCASALAYSSCCNLKLTPVTLAEICAASERYVGTQGGGLDQAACMLSEEGKALSIQFNPLKSETITLPRGACFVVMNTLIAKWKAASPEYNTRVVECKLGASILAKRKLDMNFETSEFLTLSEIQKKLGLPYNEMVDLVNDNLLDNCTSASLENEIGLSWDSIKSKFPNFPKDTKPFDLKSRCIHVYEEARRTEECVQLCKSKSFSDEQMLEKIGFLMNQCHESCRSLFQCSCEELDEIVCLSNKFGAYGAQLCGAGWGGCAIALVPSEKVETFMAQIKDNYYDMDEYRKNNFDATSMFVTKPSRGAHVDILET